MISVKSVTREDYLKRLKAVQEYIQNNLDSQLDLETLAGISNFSSYHFHRIARAFLGEPIGCYITRIRLENAARLLRESEFSIRDIAFTVGYEMPSSLTKAFRQLYDLSPSEYRNHKNPIVMKKAEINPSVNVKFKKIVDLPTRKAIYITITGEYGNSQYGTVWSKLWSFVKEHKLFSAGIEHLGISYDDPKVTENEKIRYDACLVIPKPVSPEGDIRVKEIAGGRFAAFVYQGPYDQLGAAYDVIFSEWLPKSGHELRDVPCIDKYLLSSNRSDSSKFKTEIYLPVV